MTLLQVRAVGAITSIGIGAAQTDASLRAGLCRFRRTPIGDGEVVMAFVPDDVLALGGGSWAERIVALAGLALADALGADKPSADPIAVMLGLPDPREGVTPPAGPQLWAELSRIAGHPIDPARSRTFPRGRAAIFDAIDAARNLLAQEPAARVVCGAVDSYAVDQRVQQEVAARRTLGGEFATDGRALGEAAGMLVLQTAERGGRGLFVDALGRCDDPGHRFGTSPARGEGLANAIEALRRQAEPGRAFGTVWAGLAGETHDVKQWGTACLRHRDLLRDETEIQHPADRIGDCGAGLGAMLLVDAHQRLTRGRARGPALVWAASDHGPVGCASVYVDEQRAR